MFWLHTIINMRSLARCGIVYSIKLYQESASRAGMKEKKGRKKERRHMCVPRQLTARMGEKMSRYDRVSREPATTNKIFMEHVACQAWWPSKKMRKNKWQMEAELAEQSWETSGCCCKASWAMRWWWPADAVTETDQSTSCNWHWHWHPRFQSYPQDNLCRKWKNFPSATDLSRDSPLWVNHLSLFSGCCSTIRLNFFQCVLQQ